MAFKDFVRTVKNETGDAIEITKIKTKISKEKSDIKDNYEKIGEIVYQQYCTTGAASPEIADYLNAISASKVKIKEYNMEIDRVKMN